MSSVVMPDSSSMTSPGFQEERNAFTRATASLRSGALVHAAAYAAKADLRNLLEWVATVIH